MDDPRIEDLLAELKEHERSSPEDWHRFHEFISARKTRSNNPPVPLILMAACESSASKHHRLGRQLYWCLENGCLDEAIHYLKALPAEAWQTRGRLGWFQDSYPTLDD